MKRGDFMLQVNNLKITLIKEGYPLVEGLSFTLNPNDKFAIIGDEGTGKSTLLKALVDETMVPYIQLQGHYEFRGKIGYLEQDVLSRWGEANVQSFLLKSAPDDTISPEGYEKLKHLNKALSRVYFPSNSFSFDKTMAMFSGGEIIKLALVKLLIHDVDLFLLDEPSNDLDFNTILFLERFMKEETRPILFVSHDERLLENIANGIIHLVRVKKRTQTQVYVEKMDYKTYREHRLSHYAKTLQQAEKQRSDHKKKIDRWRRVYQIVEHQQNQVVRVPAHARLLKKKIKSMQSMKKRYEKEEQRFIDIPEREDAIELYFDDRSALPKGKVALDVSIETLKVHDRVLAKNLNLKLMGRDKMAIIGANGVGKTTFLKTVVALAKKRDDLSVGYMPQDYEAMFKGKTVLEFLEASQDRKREAKVRKMLGALNFEREEMERETAYLSGGQKVKLYLLKMVVNENNVLVLDEPTRNLSPLSAPELHKLLKDYQGCILCVTHDRTFIETVFDYMIELTEEGFIER